MSVKSESKIENEKAIEGENESEGVKVIFFIYSEKNILHSYLYIYIIILFLFNIQNHGKLSIL